MKAGRTVEMTGAWKTQTRFPFVSHSPWKSLRDSHIPTAPAASVSKLSKPNPKEGGPSGGSLRSRLQVILQ